MKVLHIITGLPIGGAEMMLYNLLSSTDQTVFESNVISLAACGPVADKIRTLGIPVWSLKMQRRVSDLRMVAHLAQYIRHDQPDVIQTWLYHANLVGGLAAAIAGSVPTIWSIHHTNLDWQSNKRSTIWVATAGALFSHLLACSIVVVSNEARRVHAALGYAAWKMTVVPNGFDLSLMRPDPSARASVRQELGIAPDAMLVGLVGRFTPQKDHATFVHAAAMLHSRFPNVHFLLCGNEITWENRHLAAWIDAAGLRNRCHLLGTRNDVARLQAALDLATLSSAGGEAFPMAIGEAMACGVPCVVTSIGDSALLVGETGVVVPPRNPEALAAAWQTILAMPEEERVHLGQQARRRIEEHFSLTSVVARYEALYRHIVGVQAHPLALEEKP